MFYLTNAAGAWMVGYVQQGTSESIVHRGIRDRCNGKEVILMESDEAAFDSLCTQVHQAKMQGYVERDTRLSPIDFPTCYQAEVTWKARGVYATVQSCSAEQFQAGLARLEATVQALSATYPLTLRRSESGFTLKEGTKLTTIGVKLTSEAEWETFPAKLRELSEDRGYLDSSTLLPSGKGLLGFSTASYLTEIGLRAFLAGAMKAGAVIAVTGDNGWTFNPLKPFLKEDVATSYWFERHPEAYRLLSDAGLTALVQVAQGTPRKRMRFI